MAVCVTLPRRALEATAEERGVNLLIDPRVEHKLRVPVTVGLLWVPTATVLELLTDMAGQFSHESGQGAVTAVRMAVVMLSAR